MSVPHIISENRVEIGAGQQFDKHICSQVVPRRLKSTQQRQKIKQKN